MFTKTCFKIYLEKDIFCQYIVLYLFAIIRIKNIFSPLRISIQENKLTCHITLFILFIFVKFTIFPIQYNA